MSIDFQGVWGRLSLPVIICKNEEAWPVEYMNTRAQLLLSPFHSVDKLKDMSSATERLTDILRFNAPESFKMLCDTVSTLGHIDEYRCQISTFDESTLAVSISGLSLSVEGKDDRIALYIMPEENMERGRFEDQLSALLNAALINADEASSIQTVLAVAGQVMEVSRVYVFEEISATTTRNTYEWCAPGVEPAIQDLQNLKKAEYNYDVIVQSGMYVTNDVSTLPDEDREILEMQGICALAIVTFYEKGHPLGYVGFDDCHRTRVWDYEEIQFLKTVASLLSMLVIRRNAEQRMLSTQNVLQLISDNSEEIIYSNRLDDYKLLFVNKAIVLSLNKPQEELIGRPCYEVLQGNDKPCDFCPIPKICWAPGEERSAVYTWEHFNEREGKTFLARDNILRWSDGSYAHVETAIDISYRTEVEAKLRTLATTDTMTSVSNREWGAVRLAELLEEDAGGCLCFMDVDGLKMTNDTYGHALGDELLKETTSTINGRLNKSEFLCRWGGDEFLIWLNRTPEEAEEVVAAIQADMDHYNEHNNKPFKLAFSYGIAAFDGEEATLDALVTVADRRMYEHKMSKRERLQRRRRDDRLDPSYLNR